MQGTKILPTRDWLIEGRSNDEISGYPRKDDRELVTSLEISSSRAAICLEALDH